MNPQLAALVVHDLKNALGALEERLKSLEEQPTPQAAGKARRDCAQLRSRFLAFLLLYGDEQELRAMVADESPRELLHTLLTDTLLPVGGVPTRIGALGDVPSFWYFDRRLVRLALEAALHNAWRFARTEVVLSARVEDGYLIFAIEDDGPGLGASSNETWATGLGSALCLAVAEAHMNHGRKGFMRLANRPEGGARFEFGLP